MNAIQTKQVGKYTVKVVYDTEPESPRMWDNVGTLVCWHKRCDMGDVNLKTGDRITIDFKKSICLPVYLYEHSGQTISTDNTRYPFTDYWDAGQVGIIYVTKKNAVKEWGKKKCTKDVERKARKALESEIKTYNQYLTGQVYGIEVMCTTTEEIVDSLYGYYGDLAECLNDGVLMAETAIEIDEEKQRKKEKEKQLELLLP